MTPTETGIIVQNHEIITYIIVAAVVFVVAVAISTVVHIKIKRVLTEKLPQYLSKEDLDKAMEAYCAKCPKNTILEKLQTMLTDFSNREKKIEERQDEIRKPGIQQYATLDTLEKNVTEIKDMIKDSSNSIDKKISGVFKRIEAISNALIMRGILKLEKEVEEVDKL